MSPRQQQAKKARNYAWTPAARAKRKATYARKQAERMGEIGDRFFDKKLVDRKPKRGFRLGGKDPVHDAIIYLKLAVEQMPVARRMSRSDTLTLLALQTLQGE